MSTNEETPRPVKKLKVKAWHIIFLAILITCTLALAWWQWTRFQSGSGTFQNLGYALQWPFFGLFFVYAYKKFMAYENEKRAFEAEQADETEQFTIHDAPSDMIDEGFLPQRKQLTIEEYNQQNQPRRRTNHLQGDPQ